MRRGLWIWAAIGFSCASVAAMIGYPLPSPLFTDGRFFWVDATSPAVGIATFSVVATAMALLIRVSFFGVRARMVALVTLGVLVLVSGLLLKELVEWQGHL